MAAALGSMVAALGKLAQFGFEEDRRFLTAAVERDAAAYQAVVAAYRRPKEEREPFLEDALRQASRHGSSPRCGGSGLSLWRRPLARQPLRLQPQPNRRQPLR